MHRTFEELASQEIDRLYQGALFLQAAEEQDAEDLLLSTLTSAFHAFRKVEQGTDAARWLEGRMVKAYLSAIHEGGPYDASGREVEMHRPLSAGAVQVDPLALFKATRGVPPQARAALWLVLLRRWKYTEASAVLDIALDDLKDLLRYRHLLMTAVLPGPDERDGTNGGALS